MSIHPTAVVDAQASIDESADLGPHVVIEGPVEIGAGTVVGPHAYMTGRTRIGRGCRIHAGAVIGDLPQDRGYRGLESFCEVGDETIIREGVTIHRGTSAGSTTRVGSRCMLMVNSHVGHNCVVGDDVVLVNGTLLAGHVEVGDHAIISGNCGVHQFCRIGRLAMIGGLAKITRDVPPFFTAGRDGLCVGVNLVGMKRAGYSSDERSEIKSAYRTLFRRTLSTTSAIELLLEVVRSAPGKELIEFLGAPSRRGITAGRCRPKDVGVE
jgi:UDP-N-acetylglucosamine acyltransferase